MTPPDLTGRVAIVTGSARNIGKAIALALARAGAAVVVSARQAAAEAEAVASEIRTAGGRATVALADVKNPDAALSLVTAAIDAFGRLDILVNNASVRREVDFAQLDYAGTLVFVGTGHEHPRVDHNRAIILELTLIGAYNYDDGGFAAALELLASGALPLDLLIEAGDGPLAALRSTMDRLAAGELAGKVLVRPDPA